MQYNFRQLYSTYNLIRKHKNAHICVHVYSQTYHMQWLHEALCSQKGQDQTFALPLQMSDLLSYISHSKIASVFHLDKIVTVVVSTL